MRLKTWLLSTFVVFVIAVNVGLGSASVFAAQEAEQNDYQDHPMKSSIEYVVKNRLMWLYPDGNFRPDQPVTQADLITSLVSVQNLQTGVAVPELPQGFWAKVYYERAKAAGMLEGIIINPSKQLTREEFAQIVSNAWGKYRSGYRSTLDKHRIQAIVDSGILPSKSGMFPNGVSTTKYDGITGVSRAEQAAALQNLHQDYLWILVGESLSSNLHNSLKISGGYLRGNVPVLSGYDTRLTVRLKSGKMLDFRGGAVTLNSDEVRDMQFSVRVSGTAISCALYYYPNLPSLDRYSER